MLNDVRVVLRFVYKNSIPLPDVNTLNESPKGSHHFKGSIKFGYKKRRKITTVLGFSSVNDKLSYLVRPGELSLNMSLKLSTYL